MSSPTDVPFAQGVPFAKGHGTGNDFVIVPDPDGSLPLSAPQVAALCDRRRGIGGDGLLRAVRTAHSPDATFAAAVDLRSAPATPAQPPELRSAPATPAQPPEMRSAPATPAQPPEWFMDYRNADGSLAEMCGNGARVFARYLVSTGLAPGPSVTFLTRAGLVTATLGPDEVSVTMPPVSVGGPGVVRMSGVEFKGRAATCGNPNLVCLVDDPETLDLAGTPELDPSQFPAGANVEFVAPVAADQVRMRVVERGVGETLSCGSGACAVAGVILSGRAGSVTVDVPGGRLTVTIDDGGCVLAGPAVLVATGTASLLI